jgi:hypothetical protein
MPEPLEPEPDAEDLIRIYEETFRKAESGEQ